jgi:hypothetical protein
VTNEADEMQESLVLILKERKAPHHSRALQMAEITAERTMLEIGRVAFVDRSQVWRNGQILPFNEWPEEALLLLEGFEIIVKNAAAGDGHTDTVHKVQLAKKLGALELLAKHFALLTDVVRVDFEQSLLDRLDRGRQRAAEAHKLLESGKRETMSSAGPVGASRWVANCRRAARFLAFLLDEPHAPRRR